MAGAVFEGWQLDFWDFQKPLASVPGVVDGDEVATLARRNGARQGTPIFLGPDGRADWRVNAFWRAINVRYLGIETQRRYAFSLKVWLEFLRAMGVAWERAGRREFAAFKEWRLSAADNPNPCSPNGFKVDRAAIRRFYDWAALELGVDNPVDAQAVEATALRPARVDVAGTPGGVRKADVKWLTPAAFRQWRTIGLQGFTVEGLPADRWAGAVEDRDVAFVEGLFGTGLRLREWSSLLTIELPEVGSSRLACQQLSDACAKGGRGRPFWMRRKVIQLARFYMDDAGRGAAVARAQAAGRYEQIANRWLLRAVRASRRLRFVDDHGRSREVTLDELGPELRMRLFREGPSGLEPLWLWLNIDGTPKPKKSWYNTFDQANARVARVLGSRGGPARLWARPHMLRHSFALRWYCIATFLAWQRTALLTRAEQRDFRNQLGDVWFLLATLLGHRSAETTREVYLEPFQALDIEHLVALMDADDRASLEQLAAGLGGTDPRLLGEVVV